jgi:hypothetical protein
MKRFVMTSLLAHFKYDVLTQGPVGGLVFRF